MSSGISLVRFIDKASAYLLIVILTVLCIVELQFQVRYGMMGELPSYRTTYRLRYFDSLLVPRYHPMTVGWHDSVHPGKKIKVYFNKEGIRVHRKDISLSGKTTQPEIALVGDSIPFGGAVKYAHTFGALLKHTLQNLLIDDEIRNYAVADIGMEDYVRKITHQVLPDNPKLIILATYSNDWTTSQHQQFQMNSDNQFIPPGPFYPDFFVYQHLRFELKKLFLASRPVVRERFQWIYPYNQRSYLESPDQWLQLVNEAQWDWGAAWQEKHWSKFEENMRTIADSIERKGSKLLWVHFPVRPQLEIPRSWPAVEFVEKKAQQIADDINITYVSMLDPLRAYKPETLLYDHCHYTPFGHRVIFRILSESVHKIFFHRSKRATTGAP